MASIKGYVTKTAFRVEIEGVPKSFAAGQFIRASELPPKDAKRLADLLEKSEIDGPPTVERATKAPGETKAVKKGK